jgi:UDP-3-O-acyl-N-acetylglucosamine deacetylase
MLLIKLKEKTILDPSACGKYCRLLTITGNVALNVANAFTRIHQRVSLRERILIAKYVHSKAYVLSLAIAHSSSDVSVRIMMATMQIIEFAFQYSSKNG